MVRIAPFLQHHTFDCCGTAVNVGDEGGFAPNVSGADESLELLTEAIKKAGFEPGKDIALALDVASSEFFKDGKYHFEGGEHTAEEMANVYAELVEEYAEKFLNPYAAADRGYVDDVIDPADSRAWVTRFLTAAPPPPRPGKKRPYVDTW